MPAFNVASTIDIEVPTARVREALSDFNTWPIWSPWLIMERECDISYKGNPGELGHGYDWQGDKVGAGGMVMTALDAKRMEADLVFLKPWKSQADVAFDFESITDNTTRVTWHMDSSLPFFMFFMVGKMKAMIEADYDRGMIMLKDYLENGAIGSKTQIEGLVDIPAVLYAGKLYSSSMDNIAESMGEAFQEVQQAVSASGAEVSGVPFSVYNKMDMLNKSCRYTACVPIAAKVELANSLKIDERPACKALKVSHTGPYRHLGNAWAMGMSDLRHHKHTADKLKPPFEVYLNDPMQTAEAELQTEVYIPIRHKG